MHRALFVFVTVVSLCVVANASHYRVEQIASDGEPKSFEIFAKKSAEHEVRVECKNLGGHVVWGTTSIESCWYAGGRAYQCRATCGCRIPF